MNKIKYILLTIAICFFVGFIIYPLRTLATTRYSCNISTGQCEEDSNGYPYINKQVCQNNCYPSAKWSCSSVTEQCFANGVNGQYASENVCNNNCPVGSITPPPSNTPPVAVRATCNTQTRTCKEDPNGIYPSLSDCESICHRTPAMDNKYICNTLLHECSQDNVHGNYQGLARCLNACVKQPEEPIKRYDCDNSTWQCKEVVDGRYSPLSNCQLLCQPGGGLSCPGNEYCWACSQATLQCYQSERGTNTSQFRCQANCKLCIPKRYSCNTSTWQCEEDPNGTYPSKYLQLCKNNCVEPTVEPTIAKYSCNTSTWQCEEDSNGTYSSLFDCNSGCIESITIRYSCNTSTWKCDEDINGENSSLSKCQYNCVKPTRKRYSCNASTGKCERDFNGQYTCSVVCNRKCSVAPITPPSTSGPIYISPPSDIPSITPPSTSGPIYISPPSDLVPRSGENPPAGDPWNLDYWFRFWLGGFLRGIWE